MKADKLIKQMGPKWIGHPQFVQKKPPSVLVPNVANVQPTIACYDSSSFAQVRRIVSWVML